MRKAILLVLALSAAAAVLGSAPRAASAGSCEWACENGTVFCPCGHPRNCIWPPPPMPLCD